MSASIDIITKTLESIAKYFVGSSATPLFTSTDSLTIIAPIDLPRIGVKNVPIIFERYEMPFVDVEERQDIKFARISMYEDAETTTELVNDSRAHFSEQTYGLDINVVRAYAKTNAIKAELPVYVLRDMIVDWARNVNIQLVTSDYIYTITYIGASPITRDDRYASRTLTFTARRDLHKPQIT